MRVGFERREEISRWRLRAQIKPAIPIMQMGILIQKTQRQDVNSPIAPPIGTYVS
jgi:hypothetical protein